MPNLRGVAMRRQRERDIDTARWPFRVAAAAGGDDDVLLAIDHVGGRGGMSREGQRCLPEKFSGAAVEGVHLAVEDGGADEDDAARSHDGTTVVFRSGVVHPLCG